MISWYAVHTRPHAEAKALENLHRQGYQVYLPRYRTEIRHARRRQTVLRPLFPRYLFAGLDRAAMRWRPILSTAGVSGLVRAGDEPMPVPEAVIAGLREQDNAGLFESLARRRPLNIGELVRITAGTFEDMLGRLVELREQERVVVLLDLLGRKVCAQLEREAVEAA